LEEVLNCEAPRVRLTSARGTLNDAHFSRETRFEGLKLAGIEVLLIHFLPHLLVENIDVSRLGFLRGVDIDTI
jgi:hypothetical protein